MSALENEPENDTTAREASDDSTEGFAGRLAQLAATTQESEDERAALALEYQVLFPDRLRLKLRELIDFNASYWVESSEAAGVNGL